MKTNADCNIGALVRGGPFAPRVLCRHADLLNAYADGRIDDEGEAYLSHFAFDSALQAHYKANGGSVAGFAGPHVCRWLVLDIDAADLGQALADARKLARLILQRYGEESHAFFSGAKGFHLVVDLAHRPAPSATFCRTAKAFALALADLAGVKIDPSIYDIAHIIRLPNTKHGKTGLFKRRLEPDALFQLSVDVIRDLARHPAGDGIGPDWTPSAQLAADWADAERAETTQQAARATIRRDHAAGPDTRAPKYLMDLLRFRCDQERHATLFRSAGWLTEQGAPPSLVSALLTEPGLDVGLTPSDVARQIDCGIAHARKQAGPADPMPIDAEAAERWAIEHEGDRLPSGALEFPHGANQSEGGPT